MLKKILVFFLSAAAANWAGAQTVNYVRTWDARIPFTSASGMESRPITEVLQTTGYVDGLGRPIQTVVRQGSLVSGSSNTDMVSPNVYDALGREVQKYLPYAASSTTGTLQSSPLTDQYSFYSTQLSGQGDTYFYSNTDVEASPLNRPVKNYAPGNNWVGASRGTGITYLNNTTADDVKIWTVNGAGSYSLASPTSVYGNGLLTETHTTDEHGKQVVEYKDMEGKVILKKVQIDNTIGDSYTGWLSTYYVYDDYNNLRLVIPPKAVTQLIANSWSFSGLTALNELCFMYEYDGSNRMISKKVPGAAVVYMVYDKWDRLVLTQDGNLRAANQWVYTKYDYQNRPVMTGLYTNNTYTSQSAMQGYVNTVATGSPAQFETANSSSLGYTNSSSFPTSGTMQLLTITFYDNYNWTGNYPTAFNSRDNTNDGYFYSTGTSLYAQAMTQSSKTKGLVTGTVTYVLNSGTGQKLVSSIFYDDRARAIQSKIDNIGGGSNVVNTQYNFRGQALMTLIQHKKTSGSTALLTITKTEYDALGRLQQVKKQVIQGAVSTAETVIAANEYDGLGQLKKKTLAPAFNSNAGLEKLNYEYNVRGWLLGVNRDYITGAASNYFGMDLAYDKSTALLGSSYAAQYNGNIAGTIWRSKGDEEKRRYDFTYDNANRLLAADFNQYTSGYFNKTANVNFSVKMGDGSDYTKAYDENGNILRMQQWGLKINASSQIDDLRYSYYNSGNKLKSVIDLKDDATTKLGDFRTSANHTQYSSKSIINSDALFASNGAAIKDYGYDVNGNMITDRNKDLAGSIDVDQTSGGAITYNHLNLPQQIAVSGKGTITYTYDAAGNKLQKKTEETGATVIYNGTTYTGQTITTTTDYDAGFVYEGKTYSNSTVNSGMGYTDKLQLLGHEEGRVRAAYNNSAAPNTLTGFVFDYMIKDHLGNVRMVLTEEQQVDHYPTATLEDNALADEQKYFDINSGDVVSKPTPLVTESSTLLDYVNDNGTNNPNTFGSPTATSLKMLKLNSSGSKTGLKMVLKVMAGDVLDIRAKSYYKYTSGTVTNSAFSTTDLINAFLGTASGVNAATAHGATTTILNNNSSGTVTPLSTFTNNSANTNPYNNVKAGVCYLLFDEQFNLVNCFFDRVYVVAGLGGIGGGGGSQGGLKPHFIQDIQVPKNGYIYIYCSNESNIDVWFDNLEVTHTRGQILEETHYYPFGLTMAGISSKVAGSLANKKKFNDIELNTDFDLNIGEAFFRSHDPQLGRWWQIDPKPNNSESPYVAMSNNPVLYNDFLGDTSRYYNQQGTLLLTVGGKGSNNVMIVNDDHVGVIEGYAKKYQDQLTKLGDKVGNAKDIEAWASHMGTTYNVQSFETFYNENQVAAKSFGGDDTKNMSNFTYNGKPLKLKAEVYGDVVLKNGVVTMGTGKTSTGSATMGFFDDIPKASNSIADIHLHPISETGRFSYDYKIGNTSTTRSGTMIAGPSSADMGHAQFNHNNYRSVVVDAKNIYLYKDAGTPVIVIPRKQ